MIYTICGDMHVKPDNLNVVSELFEKLENLGNPVICLGDLFDTKEVIRGKCLNLVYEKVKASKLKWIFIVGNHDYYSNLCDQHSLETLKSLENVEIIDDYTIYADFLAMPFRRNPEDHLTFLKGYSGVKLPIFGHFDITSFDMLCQNDRI
jgi:predicted MPP superfamily phosphohydrolase